MGFLSEYANKTTTGGRIFLETVGRNTNNNAGYLDDCHNGYGYSFMSLP